MRNLRRHADGFTKRRMRVNRLADVHGIWRTHNAICLFQLALLNCSSLPAKAVSIHKPFTKRLSSRTQLKTGASSVSIKQPFW